MILSAIVDDYVEDNAVEDIKRADPKRGLVLYMWGQVNYKDIFGESHITRYCIRQMWLDDEKKYGVYIGGHNTAT